MDAGAGEDAAGGGAVLPGVDVPGHLHAGDDGFEVGVVEDEHGRLAAQLEVDALQRVGGRAGDDLSGRDVTGQRDERDARVGHEWRAGRLALTADHVEHARREQVLGPLGELERAQRRQLGRLEHDGVAGRERGPDLPGRHHERIVPGRDRRDDPERVASDHRRVAAQVLARGLPLEAARRAREEAQVVGCEPDLVAERGDRLADVARLDLRQLVAVLLDAVRELQEDLGAFLRRRRRPLGKRGGRRADRGVDVGGVARRHLGDLLDRSPDRAPDRSARCVRGPTCRQ